MKDDNNHLASELSTKSATSVSQGAASPRTQDIKHRANHSSAILLKSTSERADLPNSVKNDS